MLFCFIQLTLLAHNSNSRPTSFNNSDLENGKKYTTSLIRPKNSSRRKCSFKIGWTTLSLKFLDIVTFGLNDMSRKWNKSSVRIKFVRTVNVYLRRPIDCFECLQLIF